MDYEQKYRKLVDAIKVMRDINPSDEGLQNWINDNVPELAESDDERIREELIDAIQGLWDNDALPLPLSAKRKESWIAWLEKQESYTFEIKAGHWYKCVCDYMLNGSDLMFKNDRLYYCRSNWRLEGELYDLNVKDIGVDGYKSFFRPATNQETKDWLEKQASKTKWSEEDDYNVQCCIAKAERDIANGYHGRNKELIEWLKSIKDRVK